MLGRDLAIPRIESCSGNSFGAGHNLAVADGASKDVRWRRTGNIRSQGQALRTEYGTGWRTLRMATQIEELRLGCILSITSGSRRWLVSKSWLVKTRVHLLPMVQLTSEGQQQTLSCLLTL